MIIKFSIVNYSSLTKNVNRRTVSTFCSISIKYTVQNFSIITLYINCTCITRWSVVFRLMLFLPITTWVGISTISRNGISSVTISPTILTVRFFIIMIIRIERNPTVTICISFISRSDVICKSTI